VHTTRDSRGGEESIYVECVVETCREKIVPIQHIVRTKRDFRGGKKKYLRLEISNEINVLIINKFVNMRLQTRKTRKISHLNVGLKYFNLIGLR